jgi:hypothetical protein
LGTVASIGYIVIQFGENLEGTIIRGLLSKADLELLQEMLIFRKHLQIFYFSKEPKEQRLGSPVSCQI